MLEPKIGLSMLHVLDKPFNKMIKLLLNVKTHYIEIVDDGFHTLNKNRVSTLNDIAESYKLEYSIHAPFADINIASQSESLLRAMFKRLKKSIAHAGALNAYMWVFHSGLKTGISMFYPNMNWVQNLKTVQSLIKTAKDYGVKIAMENTPEPYPFLMKNVEDFTRFYEEVDDPIDLVLDIGHANVNGQIESFLTTFPDKIMHIHAHDNDGKGDQHLGIGYGTVNWKNVASLLKKNSYDKVLVIESVEHIEESIHKLKQLLA
jgi:sugar phosphate isomerase/epimerase